MILDLRYIPIIESNIEFSFGPSCILNWDDLSLELGRVVLVRNFIGPSGLVRVVSGPSCPAPPSTSTVSRCHDSPELYPVILHLLRKAALVVLHHWVEWCSSDE